jgi:pyruvate kinase
VDAGADAIMLSGETAVGHHPVRAVKVLDSIIRNAESVPPIRTLPTPSPEGPDHLHALSDAAVTLAARGGADAIVAITREGRTARLLSARRPETPIFAVTDKVEVARRLPLWWGVTPVIDSLVDESDAIAARVVKARFGSPSIAVIVNTSPDLESTKANFLRVRRI